MVANPILIFWSDEDDEDVAVVPDLCGCSASGATVEEAAREAQTAMRLWLAAARDIDSRSRRRRSGRRSSGARRRAFLDDRSQ